MLVYEPPDLKVLPAQIAPNPQLLPLTVLLALKVDENLLIRFIETRLVLVNSICIHLFDDLER